MVSLEFMNILLDSIGIITCAILLLLLMLDTDNKSRLNRLFMRLTVCNLAVLAFDLISWLCTGWQWQHALTVDRTSVFISYSLSFLIIPLFADYLTAYIGDYTKVWKHFSKLMYALYGAVLLLIIISQFNGMLYYYDENGIFHAGHLFWLSQVFTLVNILLLASLAFMYRKSISGHDTLFLYAYLLFPLIAVLVYVINPEIELHYAATTLALITCYGGINVRKAKQAARLTQTTLSSLENIMDAINTSVYVIEPGTCKLLFVNKWLKTFYGRENEDLTGKYCYEVFRGFDEKCSFCPFFKLEENPEQTVIWEEFLEPYGIYVRHSFCYINWPNVEKAVLHYGVDITEIYEKTDLLVKLEKQERELAENRMSIMLSQIQPHFLYNSLTSISALCGENEQARKALLTFSRYLRGNMDSLTQKKLVPFDKELQHVKKYLYLEKLRFEEKLQIVYDIQATDFTLPALTVQPIVENAVHHGLFAHGTGGTVTIKTEETKSAFVITVKDDGVGFDTDKEITDETQSHAEARPLDFSEPRNHVGIKNVRSRLYAMCGGTLDIESKPGAGTSVAVTIPKHSEQ